MIHLGSKTKGQGVQEHIAVPNQVVPNKALKSVQEGVSGSSKKKKVSFGPLEESFTNSEKYISCVTDKILAGLRSKYHILDTVKVRAPTTDERPIIFMVVRLLFVVRPLMLAFVSQFTRSFKRFFTLCMWPRYS